MSETKKSITPMGITICQISFVVSSRIITTISEEDKAGFILKTVNLWQLSFQMKDTNDCYKAGIDINEY